MPLALTIGEVGASTAKSLRFSLQSLTHQTSHNKHASIQSSLKYAMHDMLHTLWQMICMMCNYLGKLWTT